MVRATANASTADFRHTGPVQPPDTIRCVDCLGLCERLTYRAEDDPFVPGDVVAYRCRDCLDRWDIVLEVEDLDEDHAAGSHGQSLFGLIDRD